MSAMWNSHRTKHRKRMPYEVLSLLLVLSCVSFSACGAVYVCGFFDNCSAGTCVGRGTVSIVQLTFVSDDHGNSVSVTVVTFLQHGDAREVRFCGSQASQFPINSFVTVNYTPGSPCSTLVSVSLDH